MICNEGRSAMSDDDDDKEESYGDDERAASDVTVGLVCSVLELGFGLLCIGVWFVGLVSDLVIC